MTHRKGFMSISSQIVFWEYMVNKLSTFNTLRVEQDDHHFQEKQFSIFKLRFVNKYCYISVQILLQFIPDDTIKISIGSGLSNRLSPKRRQAIIWTNEGKVYYISVTPFCWATLGGLLSSFHMQINTHRFLPMTFEIWGHCSNYSGPRVSHVACFCCDVILKKFPAVSGQSSFYRHTWH